MAEGLLTRGRGGKLTKHAEITGALRREILGGVYAPGQRLPSQRELARRWRTTMVTMRRVLEALTDEGLLRVEHGLGTFVADLGREHDALPLSSFNEDLASSDIAIKTELLSVEEGIERDEAAEALHLPVGSALVSVTRKRYVEGVPILHQTSYLSGEHRGVVGSYDAAVPLYAFLRDRLGLIAAAYRETLSSIPLPEQVAGHLGSEPGAPAIFSRKLSCEYGGEPFLYDEAYMPSGRIELVVHRSGDRYRVEYHPLGDAARVEGGDPG